jgi:hypothetical protein
MLSRHVELRVTGLAPRSRYRATHVRVDNEHAGAFGEWTRLGKPPAPSGEQMARIQGADHVEELVHEAEVSADGDGALRASFDLPMPALSLFALAPVAMTKTNPSVD